jgi:hypothetical protein
MTVANLLVEPMRIRLLTDTVGYRGKDPADFCRKVYLVENASIAFVVRGFRALGHVLQKESAEWSGIDAAIDGIAALLREAPARFLQNGMSEVTVIGWHRGNDCPRAVRLLAKAQPESITVRQFDLEPGAYLAPTLGNHPIPADMTDQQLLKVAILQQEIATKHGLNICIGGDMELTTIDAAGVTVRKIGEYPNKAFTAERIARSPLYDAEDVAA